MKKIVIFSLLLAVTWLLPVALCHAAEGKRMFISKCGQCHKSGGEAEAFAATKYASKQWERFFQRNKHGRKKDISDRVTQEELDQISDYLMSHAADSDQPEAVGLR